jgi:hypothetical protein
MCQIVVAVVVVISLRKRDRFILGISGGLPSASINGWCFDIVVGDEHGAKRTL